MTTTSDGGVATQMRLEPNSDGGNLRYGPQAEAWIANALRGLELGNRDQLLVARLLQDGAGPHVAVIIERARQEERDRIAADGTAKELVDRARAEGHAAGRAEAAAEARKTLAEHQEQVAADRRRQSWLWSQLQESFGSFEG